MSPFPRQPAAATLGARILIVDDQAPNVQLLQRLLERAGYREIRGTTDSRAGLAAVAEFHPDVILLDLHMPELDGFAVLDALQPHFTSGEFLPVLVLTADSSDETTQAALSRGAKDFLAKPFHPVEVVLRVQNLLETRFLYRLLQNQNHTLEASVRQRTRQLDEAQIEVLERLASAAEFRDDDTGRHTRRVGELAARLGRALGLADERVEIVRRAAPLHDVGKIGIPDSILLKPGRLTPREREIMRSHTVIGAGMLSGGSSALVRAAERIARSHHEHWDGGGYPDGIAGEEIPVEARLVAVADYLDALTHDRPYRKAWTLERAIAGIRAARGRQFDPEVVDALLASFPEGSAGAPEEEPHEPHSLRR
ncbi:MAG TPA: HD domain-containing phosphohydrolase [Gemmatimonadaceae bacterium]|nr:HD domain-containing phosphohydrolase [Gemmatimonadaceae bacterium]